MNPREVQRKISKCPEEPCYQTTSKSERNANRITTRNRQVRTASSVTTAHWEYLYRLRDILYDRDCTCGCDGNILECSSEVAVRYRNLRHYIFEAFESYTKKISSISYSRRSNSVAGFERIVSRSDAISTALQYMLKKIDIYDCNDPSGASFMTFIFQAIKNSVIDEMRALSDFPNIVAARKRVIAETRNEASSHACGPVTDEEILEFANSKYDEKRLNAVNVAYGDSLSHKTTSNQSVSYGGTDGDLHDNIEGACCGSELTLAYRKECKEKGSSFNKYLSYITDDVVRGVVALSYCSDLNVNLIATTMGISPSLVSRMKKQGEAEIKKIVLLERSIKDKGEDRRAVT